jgi:hypothetical protein
VTQLSRSQIHEATRVGGSLAAALLLCGTLTGCLVAGYSSGGGWFIWPGGLGLLVIVAVVIFLMRR